jgi:superfamily II DNA or RNA helicase
MYFYIQDNKDWNYENKVKYGIADDYKSRLKTDQHSYKSEFISLFSYEINENYKLNYKEIDNIISKQRRDDFKIKILNKYPLIHFDNLFKIKEFLINQGGGTEFINKDGIELLEKILLNDFEKLGIIIRKIPREEWIFDNNNEESDEEKLAEEEISDENKIIFPIQDNIRDYQEIIINDALLNIKKDNRVYISLATGGGKSLISYTILNELLSSTIIILTPRINICCQNINDKYLNLLSNTYKIYHKNNLNKINKDENNIICCCINSYKKVVEVIKNANLRDVLIWFDEAHYGIDNWIINSNEYKEFLLKDNKFIKYRLFTSASPDKDFVSKNNRIFGEFINPIKVKYLIENDWLCNIDTYIYKDEIIEEISEKDNVNFIINKFVNKKVGLCFSNSCENALNLFTYHLELYEKNKEIPKPFLLLNSNKIDEYIKDKKIFNENSNLFTIKGYEEDGDFKRIGYIVKMYSMGYDNHKIDFIFFKDPKMSHKDIIQSIGRGLRPDGLKDGRNLNKRTDIIIPVYINDRDNAKNYDKIKEVIKYLILDVEIDISEIKVIDKKKNKKLIEDKDKEEVNEFMEDIETIIYEIQNKNMTEQMIIRQLKYNDINNYSKYLKYINENPKLNFPEKIFEIYPLFNFNETYKNNSSPYYSREECIKMIKIYEEDLIFEDEMDKEDNIDLLEFLIKKDKKIPNECLWFYYGGNKKDFIIFV